MKKVIRDGKVAVLYSPGVGAGWYSWTGVKECLFDPDIVALVEAGASPQVIEELADQKWPNEYWGGAQGLRIEWLDEGDLFYISHCSGDETIHYPGGTDWIAA